MFRLCLKGDKVMVTFCLKQIIRLIPVDKNEMKQKKNVLFST